MKRLFGRVQTRSKLEIIMTPVSGIPPLAKGVTILSPTGRLTSLLPPNVVLPTSSLSLVLHYYNTLCPHDASSYHLNYLPFPSSPSIPVIIFLVITLRVLILFVLTSIFS